MYPGLYRYKRHATTAGLERLRNNRGSPTDIRANLEHSPPSPACKEIEQRKRLLVKH